MSVIVTSNALFPSAAAFSHAQKHISQVVLHTAETLKSDLFLVTQGGFRRHVASHNLSLGGTLFKCRALHITPSSATNKSAFDTGTVCEVPCSKVQKYTPSTYSYMWAELYATLNHPSLRARVKAGFRQA